LCGAGIKRLMILYSDFVQSVLPWLSGGLTGVGWMQLEMIVYYVLVAIILSIYAFKHIRIMRLGDEMASLLGHKVERSRFFLIVLS
ncbi:iron chelate uptake ABC transporter family permease subunit, partial [Lysinibacillus fusiformis]|uniref:iron chelate uptake ABC transporter family permease subunit n=1 Tax=Lysinibacillus fusiformis TaxID=28031 RepID=UPI0020C0288A